MEREFLGKVLHIWAATHRPPVLAFAFKNPDNSFQFNWNSSSPQLSLVITFQHKFSKQIKKSNLTLPCENSFLWKPSSALTDSSFPPSIHFCQFQLFGYFGTFLWHACIVHQRKFVNWKCFYVAHYTIVTAASISSPLTFQRFIIDANKHKQKEHELRNWGFNIWEMNVSWPILKRPSTFSEESQLEVFEYLSKWKMACFCKWPALGQQLLLVLQTLNPWQSPPISKDYRLMQLGHLSQILNIL